MEVQISLCLKHHVCFGASSIQIILCLANHSLL